MSEDRTWLASVLFLDIVDYSILAVNQQLAVKRHFQNLVFNELQQLDTADTINLDTGDGMAICYLGDPEPVFAIARRLRDQFVAMETGADTSYQVRLGLNLGPIKIIEDVNQGKNCVGTGINDAQRIMSFAAPNQLLVSKSYFEMVSQLSQDYTHSLRHIGMRADKHDQQHDVYELAVEVVKVDNLSGQVSSPTAETPAVQAQAGLDTETVVRIQQEYAKYMGSTQADQIIQQQLPAATSIAGLCRALLQQMSAEDDRYSFEEFLKYYGYAGY